MAPSEAALIEPARAFDAPRIGAILSEFIDGTEWMPRIHTHAEDQGFARWLIDVADVTVARLAGGVCGFMALQQDEIQALYVAAAARGRGVGSALIDWAKSGRGALALWTFQANGPARRFYAAHGFVEGEKTDGAGNDEKLPDLRMIWRRQA